MEERLAALTVRDEHRLRGRLRRGGGGAADAKLLAELERAEERVARRRAAVPEIAYPPELPVTARREDLLAAIRDHQVVVVAGETGSGKTTQLPKLCLELGRGVRGAIAHTQPRRIAARTVAERIADELGVALGDAVGYSVRFADRSGDSTLVRLLTDGLLLAQTGRDRLLRQYDTIIVDEAHERSLNVDFLLGYLARILPQRPDLKLIITSATIDPGRFAEHFGGAPVVEVSGRTYPVEVRYRPVEDPEAPDRDQVDAIGDAVDELLAEGTDGDVLVFLSGEREIRDTAEALRGRLPERVEVLPLYARLATAEQQRVFKPHRGRRVVLATNVAETSLTVPGIKYVVDPGTARISRYSARLKVQRLPIEAISQASADQRKGRCGRTSDGICVRLYSQVDFEERPRFTDPEILRTNLASVILQMAWADLGSVEDFPFLDPPDPRQIRDGLTLLEELNAIGPDRRLTPIGRRLAQLPVDPRLGRMVLEADARGCAEEVVVIAAALSIQDPRERPTEHRAHADQLHARFADEHSDFLAFWNLWRHLREQQRELSGNQFRKRCKAEYLHYLRIREWQDLAGSLRQAAKNVDVKLNGLPSEPEPIHVSLLAGLLSHLGLRDVARRDYLGARGARFSIFPGSVLSRKQPAWVMVAELVETSRLFGRTAARVEPRWIEPLAEHLIRRTYDEPRWEAKRGSAVATERATLYGLPVVAGRTVPYGRIDPVLSRELFIQRALVEGDWATRHRFLEDNRGRIEEVEALEERARRRDILVADRAVYDFYAARIPESVISGRHFDAWWKDARRAEPGLLTLAREDLVRTGAADALDTRARPDAWRQGDLVLALSYRFEPGAEHDGITVHVPLTALAALRDTGFDWLVPAFRLELITALIRSLPKEHRRRLVPVPDVAAGILERLTPRSEPVLDALARELEASRGVRAAPADFDVARLPPYLRVTFSVEDDEGRVVASGQNLAAVRAAARPKLRARLASATASIERTGARDWAFGTLPQSVELPGTAGAVRAFAALVDEGATVGVRTFETEGAARAAMRQGTRRLLLLTLPSPVRAIGGRLGTSAQLALSTQPGVIDDAVVASVDALLDAAGGPAWDEAGFARLRSQVAERLPDTAGRAVEQVVAVLGAAREVQRRLDALHPAPLQAIRRDVARQLGGLVYPGWVTATRLRRLGDVERYLRGAAARLDRLPDGLAGDLDRMRAVHELEAAYEARRAEAGAAAVREARWLLEELRMAQFAQHLGVRGPVSAKQVRRALAGAAG